eukprot:COSAG01_NODE_45717_length_406_cov_78.104235_1_plen_72_part_01
MYVWRPRAIDLWQLCRTACMNCMGAFPPHCATPGRTLGPVCAFGGGSDGAYGTRREATPAQCCFSSMVAASS